MRVIRGNRDNYVISQGEGEGRASGRWPGSKLVFREDGLYDTLFSCFVGLGLAGWVCVAVGLCLSGSPSVRFLIFFFCLLVFRFLFFFSVLFCLSVCQCLLLYLIVICLFVCLFVCQSPSVSVISNDIFYFFITALNVGNLSLISIFGSLDYM